MNYTKKTLALGLLTLGVTGASIAAVACSDDAVVPTPTVDAGKDSATLTDYDKLGGYPGILGAVKAIVAELQQPGNEIPLSYFAHFQLGNGGKSQVGSPTLLQVEQCFAAQVASFVDGVESKYKTYPNGLMVDADAAGGNTSAWACRDTAPAHVSTNIHQTAYDMFVAAAGKVLTGANAPPAVLANLTNVLGLPATIARVVARDSGNPSYVNPNADGGDGGH